MVYLDDILVFAHLVKEHKHHLALVFGLLHKH